MRWPQQADTDWHEHIWTTFNALFSGWWERALIRADENDRFLLCCIGSRSGALAPRDVRETMRPLPVEPLAGAPPLVRGLATIRGYPTPVVDVGRLLDSSESSCAPTLSPSLARFVSLELGERTAALAADAVLGVRSAALRVKSRARLPSWCANAVRSSPRVSSFAL